VTYPNSANKTIIIVKENQFNIDSSYIYN